MSVYTQVKIGNASTLIKKIQKQNVQLFGHVYRSTNGQNHVLEWKIQSFLSKRICTFRHWQDYCGNVNLKKFYWTSVGKNFKLGTFFVIRARRRFFPVYVDDVKLTNKTENMEPFWKKNMEDVDLDEPTPFLDHVYLDCTQRKCQISKYIVANC